jgi:hypothetical protein
MGNKKPRMDAKKRSTGARLMGAVGVSVGGLAGVAAVVLTGAAVAQQVVQPPTAPILEATHLPPLLAVAGERVELRYDVYCGKPEGHADAPCAASGSVFLRIGETRAFRELPLREDPDAVVGRFVATIPSSVSRSGLGFSYYAVLRSKETGAAVTLPAGGADAPQRSLPLTRSVDVALGTHAFGDPGSATARVASARWGTGLGEVGLEQDRNLTPIGGSSFDVDPSGAVVLLDEANRRLLRFEGSGMPEHVPLAVNGTLADLAIGGDGEVHVLEVPHAKSDAPVLRTFDGRGTMLSSRELAEEHVSQVSVGPSGEPVVLQDESAQWMAIAESGRTLTGSAQLESGRSGRPLPDGGEVVLLRVRDEIRVALVDRGVVRDAWRVQSDTPIGEVQLAEPYGDGLVVVAHLYTDARDEFEVLVLDEQGVARRFPVASAAWAESAPLSRFRLAGSSLYHLGSTPEGVFVDRFDLEVS